MLSITNNQQVNFRRNDNKVTDSDIQKYEKVQDELNEDTFVSENIEQTKPKHRNAVSKFFRNIVLGTAIIGGATATQAVEAQTHQAKVGDVIKKEILVNPKKPSDGKATYYYTQKTVLDSIVNVEKPEMKKFASKCDRTLLNTYPDIKYSETNISPQESFKYSYTTKPLDPGYFSNGVYETEEYITDLNGKKITDIVPIVEEDYYPDPDKYTLPESHYSDFFDPNSNVGEVSKYKNKTVKKGTGFHSNHKPIDMAAYFTDRPVLDSVVVEKPNNWTSTTRLNRDKLSQEVNHINYTDSKGQKGDYWIEKNGNFIKYTLSHSDHLGYGVTQSIWDKPVSFHK